MLVIECYQDNSFQGYYKRMNLDTPELTMQLRYACKLYDIHELVQTIDILEKIPGYTYIVKEMDICIA